MMGFEGTPTKLKLDSKLALTTHEEGMIPQRRLFVDITTVKWVYELKFDYPSPHVVYDVNVDGTTFRVIEESGQMLLKAWADGIS